MSTYDLVIIGTGPGGYVCAIRAAQLGMKVAVVEKRATHGGTCLNVGCIPSKALLHASEAYAEAAHDFDAMGIKVTPELDLPRMLAFKNEGVKGNVDGVELLLKKNKVDAFHGTGRITAPHAVEVTGDGRYPQTLETKAIVIATGSSVAHVPGIDIDEKRIVSSTGALELPAVPKRMVVIGGGYIGLELGSVWARLGAEVTVVEMLHTITPGLDGELAKNLQRILQKQGLTFKLGAKVVKVDSDGGNVALTIEPVDGGLPETLECDVVLVAVGRVPNTEGLGLSDVGVETHARGRVVVDHKFQTNVPGIYAIGDVIAGPMLAHKAQDEGIAVAEDLAGQAGHVNYDVIPSVVYTAP
ncbi:MAG: dihydrolipoyl dehydrogenase, partial [Hyphomicrobiaceae bacterium]|nr:dihydrolipoyl dehydrogenase [Hyphomicrobiaceae bacterium]MDX2450932.1 dihydrolipoyl dehydrogenase [Hyphomicrobiaceae bacterium]